METFDTNVVVRLLVVDDPEQSALAERRWRSALGQGGALLPLIVLVETAWVLRTAYRFQRSVIASQLRLLVSIEGVEIESSDLALRALRRYQDGPADLSDYLILELASDLEVRPVQTFDRRFASEDGVELVG